MPLVPLATAALVLFLLAELAFVGQAWTETGCDWCHVPRQAAEEHRLTPHKDVRCLECHQGRGGLAPLELNLRAAHDLWEQITPWTQPDPSRAALPDRVCLGCHAEDIAALTTSAAMRMSHREPVEAGMGCRDCHAQATHGASATSPVPGHSSCSGCHDGRQAGNGCTVCHRSRPEETALPAAEDMYHGPDGLQLHGLGTSSSCPICHPRTFCKPCHDLELPHDPASFPFLHGKTAIETPGACADCHAQRFCDDCHKTTMPHADDYLARHPQETDRVGRETCNRCHVAEDCRTCHEAHDHPPIPPEAREQLQQGPAS